MSKAFSTEIFRQFERMCSSHDGKCDGCKMTSMKIRDKDYCEWLLKVNPSKYEEIVKEWADANPETVRLTWYDAITVMMLKDIAKHKIKTPISLDQYLRTPIPYEIAEKLGVEPERRVER